MRVYRSEIAAVELARRALERSRETAEEIGGAAGTPSALALDDIDQLLNRMRAELSAEPVEGHRLLHLLPGARVW